MTPLSLSLSLRATYRYGSLLNVRSFCVTKAKGAGQEEESRPELMYQGSLTPQIKNLKIFSLGTSIAGVALQPFVLQELGQTGTGLVIAFASIMGFFTFGTPFLIHHITKKYVTEMSYDWNSDSYTATTLSFILRRKPLTFTMKDVHIPDIPGMFTTLKVGNKPLFLTPEGFYSREHYLRIMKLDQPIDFGIPKQEK